MIHTVDGVFLYCSSMFSMSLLSLHCLFGCLPCFAFLSSKFYLIFLFSNLFFRRDHYLLILVCVTSHWMFILHLSTGVKKFSHSIKLLAPSNCNIRCVNIPMGVFTCCFAVIVSGKSTAFYCQYQTKILFLQNSHGAFWGC